MSSQLTKLNGDFGREKCRDPKYNHLLANIVIFANVAILTQAMNELVIERAPD